MTDKIFQYCKRVYTSTYRKAYADFLKGKTASDKTRQAAEQFAQKLSIRASLKEGVSRFPDDDVADIWRGVYKVHIFRKSGINVDEQTVAKVISAEQSWRKSSGHAFEELIKELANLSLQGTNVAILLQKDLNLLIKAGEIANEPRDIAWIEKQIRASIFDLYAIVEKEDKQYVFGCIQSKTSIRDRVTRDREPSMHAMQSFFWSACIALDGEFRRMAKLVGMVNGGTQEFPENGWHGMYVLSEIVAEDRIYKSGFDLALFTEHAKEAAKYWLSQRQWFNLEWKATMPQ